ncbi:MAG: glycoside hydrolase family 2 protein [Chitinispirillaceae bacterium]|nr:glycoside hydrolase family 2 protein [Chitinispirillaceae bacterium]
MILELNTGWKFRYGNERRWRPATVPGCIHCDLQRNGLIPDPFRGANELDLGWIERTDFEYCREFVAPAGLLRCRTVELVAEGLDTLARISINGTEVASTENMFIGYRFDVKRVLVPGPNSITVRFNNPMNYIKRREGFPWFDQPNDPVGGAAGIRKMQCSFGWDWGPRLPTCGIFRPLRIEGRNGPRISHVFIKQLHSKRSVVLQCRPETEGGGRRGYSWCTSIAFEGIIAGTSPSLELALQRPRLWWPNGHGAQPLYTLTVELLHNGTLVDTWKRRIGLRTVILDRSEDRWGECFRFLVNGRPVYAKGASWVPAHAFPSSIDKATYRDLIGSAAGANFTMLRVWGGGLYEHDAFYDYCDEYGIMVWHDFMFSCSLYPGDDRFMHSVGAEARFQVRRLAHHACMALWCGNNELEQYYTDIRSNPDRKAAYERIFYAILPKAVKKYAPHLPYWPSSPHNPEGYEHGYNSETSGDAHYWDVWHGRQRPEAAQRHHYRFWSEFGMQSYCSMDTALQFADPAELNIFGPAMENHQKHPIGNALILHYIGSRYRFPKDFASLVHLSQVNQASCVGMMVEHQRACMPRTMGSLYWQLNDCWPVFSWSSIDFGGQWKGLHYAAKRFFAPALVTYRMIGEETVGKINRLINTIRGVRLITAYDLSASRRAKLCWDLYRISDGAVVLHGEKAVTLRPNEAVVQKTVDCTELFSRYAKNDLVMRLTIAGDTGTLSRNTVLFTAPRFIELPKERVRPRIDRTGKNRFVLHFKSTTFQHQVAFHLHETKYRASDNFFDLFPGIVHSVTVTVEEEKRPSAAWVKKRMRIISVAETY